MRHVLLFAVLSLTTVTFAADKLPEKKAPKPSDKAAETKTHALPADATATVIVLDYLGGMIKPKNNDPLMVIRADGSVTLENRYQKNARIETRITKDDLQTLLRLAVDTNDFFKINAAEIGQSIAAKVKRVNERLRATGGGIYCGPNIVADGATTVVRIHADGKDHQVRLYDLRGKSRFLRNDERLTRLKNIVTRLRELERKLRAGATKAEPGAAKEEPPGTIRIHPKPHVMRMQPDGTIKCGE